MEHHPPSNHHLPTRARSYSFNSDVAAAETPKRGTGRSNSPWNHHGVAGVQHKRSTRSKATSSSFPHQEPTQFPSVPVVHYRATRRQTSPMEAVVSNSSLPASAPFLFPTSPRRVQQRPATLAATSTPVITPTASDASYPSNTSSLQKKYTRSYDWTDEPANETMIPRPPSPESTVLTGPTPFQPIEDDTASMNNSLRTNDIVHIRFGTSTTVTHSRRKLRRSSPYFRKLLTDPSTEILQLEHSNARDWHTLMEQFVLTNSKQHRKHSANDWGRPTSMVLPDFLPWFVVLELGDCLKTADTALGIVLNGLPDVQSHSDAMDRLKICAIAKTANLRTTMEEAFASTAKQFMLRRGCFLAKTTRETSLLWTTAKLLVGCLTSPNQDDEEDDDEVSGCSGDRTADDILESIQHCDLFVPKSASLLCRAVFEYIPEECLMDHLWAANRSQLLRLLKNPLFPHLLRAGIIDDDSSLSPDVPKTFSFMLWEDDTSKRKRPTEWLERIWNHLQKPPKLVAISSETFPNPEHHPPRRFQC